MLLLPRLLTMSLFSLVLAGCFHTELGSSVTGARVTVTDLRSGESIEDGLTSLTEAGFIATRSQDEFDELNDLAKLLYLGNFFVDGKAYDPETWYLITARGGADIDVDSNFVIDAKPATEVNGLWHALITGRQLRNGNFVISPITEALYQLLKTELDDLDNTQLRVRLNQLSAEILGDVNNDERVNYVDALKWTTIVHKPLYLRDFSQVDALAQAIRDGANQTTLSALAQDMFAEPAPDALQYYQQNISAPIVQTICVRCHMPGGSAPNSGSALVLVTNNTANFQEKNHQNFQDFRDQLPASRDLSDWVTGKASGQISHGGGRQLAPGSQELENLETYLNLLE
jgi:hypothetical protein